MRRSRLGAFGALCAVALVIGATGVAPAATPPSATASQALVAGSPSAISCSGSVDARVTVTSQAGTTGTATAVMLMLDLSGSTGRASKLADLKAAAQDALDCARRGRRGDRSVDRGQPRRHRRLPGLVGHARRRARLELQRARRRHRRPPGTARGSPHGAGINMAASALATRRRRIRQGDRADHRRTGRGQLS